ncbi:GAF domain-containing protein [Streptomyces shenzhenensis]|uniref:GAF domain-containing protein n=1 Tax=Streptomyces shenzhenensis TaxID=943815 RepID=UPI0015F0068C|nr:GAF domain-containing protein [Streptomyces shenzhenensis]
MSAAEREPHRPDPSARCPTAPDPGRLYFPDPARLELDQAVESLLAAAQEVQRAQDRFRALLRAVMLVTDESDPGEVLRQLVTSARDLTGADWAALVPTDEPARSDEMIRAGPQGVAAGRLDRIAHGLHALQGLFEDRDTVRVDDAARHLPGAPPVSALLGSVIRTRGGDVAHLYLADKHRPGHSPGPFTSEDEELVQVLASAAGNTMDHADLHDRAIHDLYAIGLDLHSIAGRLDADRQRAVLDVVDRVDEVIKDVTNTVFGLRTGPER